MNPQAQPPEGTSDFRTKSALAISVTALLLVMPFSINNLLQGRYLLGGWSLVIVAILAINAWTSARGRHFPTLTLLGLTPSIILFLSLAFQKQGIIGALWCYPAVLSFYVMLPERKAWLANIVLLAVSLSQAWLVLDPSLAARVTATLLAVSIISAIFVRVITIQQRKLEALAVTDPLTGLANRLTLHSTLEQAIQQSCRSHVPLTLLTLDLDHFKSINDTLGHESGDLVLRVVGELLRKRIRRADQVFRIGGEEFIALLYDTDMPNGRRLAEELREAVETLRLLPERSITVSIGIATLRPDESWMEWMKRSDANLYRAKSEGRNRVAG
ncbi:MAG TPA: GGDEF domain-containing protein [Gallionella sp.]